MSSVVLISDLLYQSASIVFLYGGRVSEELVMVSLAFHLFVVATVIFASVLLCQVTSSQELLYSFKGKYCATHKATKIVYICKRLTLKKYATTRSIAHSTIDNKHMVSLAFHLFVVGTVIFASVLLCQVKARTSLFLQRKILCHT